MLTPDCWNKYWRKMTFIKNQHKSYSDKKQWNLLEMLWMNGAWKLPKLRCVSLKTKSSTICRNYCHSVLMCLIWSRTLRISIWSVSVLISSKFKLTFSKPCTIGSKRTPKLNIFQKLSMPECLLSTFSIRKQTSISVFASLTNKQFPEKLRKLSLMI